MTGTTIFRKRLSTLLEEKFTLLARKKALPAADAFRGIVLAANRVLLNEEEHIRPADKLGLPGGIVMLNPDLPTLIIPDLHSRVDFLLNILLHYRPHTTAPSVLERLEAGTIQVVSLGDAIHSEGRARKRWRRAMEEYQGGYNIHKAIDAEMQESLTLLEMLMLLKISFPEHFHFLKGNHENITNEEGEGNHSFAKFACEGPMVYYYMQKFYTEKVVFPLYQFEKRLPLLAVGGTFLASHAEPAEFYGREAVTEYRNNAEVVEGLTWTDNGQATAGSVRMMLDHYLGAETPAEARYITGHRAIADAYTLRADGLLVQIHNPERYPVAVAEPGQSFDPDRDLRFLHKKETTRRGCFL